jgi:ethanolamine utilization protein EutN
MQLGRIVGNVVVTVKDPALSGVALLLVQPLGADGRPSGRVIVAADSAGAGPGEHVFVVRGREAAFPFRPAEPPADASIVGIVDHWVVDAGRPGSDS